MNDAFDNAQADKEALARYGESLTHARTCHQPYAWAVASGHCPIINSTVRPPLEMVGKLIGIHASRSPRVAITPEFVGSGHWSAALLPPDDSRLTYGALIGVARLVGVVRRAEVPLSPGPGRMIDFVRGFGRGAVAQPIDSDTCARIRPWWRGPWGWLLEEAVLLPEPIQLRGQQGLWRIPHLAINYANPVTLANTPRWADSWALEQWRAGR